jgi:ferredoxin
MLPQILPKDKFGQFVSFILADHKVVAPMAKGPCFAFGEVASAADVARVRMDYDITILPPKKYLLPTFEKLLEFSGRDPSSATAVVASRPLVILGVHPYDMHALATLDAAMRTEPADANYIARADATRIIGMNICGYATDQQFMADMGTTEPPEGLFDLFLTDLGDRYYVEAGKDAGADLAKYSGVCHPAGKDDHKGKLEFDIRKAESFAKRLPYNTKYLPELLDASYDSLLWDAVSRRCFSCGTCTNVCPTCYCFDVQDKLNLDTVSGTRRRMWDSCQLKVFAEVAGGENFREHRASRLRHRMFRKGKFIHERTGKLGCVGCGRCSKHCVANISILEAFQQIGDEAEVTQQ